jgi:hypothetical protein
MTETAAQSGLSGFSWSAALLGGSVAIAGGAFFGTLVAAVSVRLLMAQGSSAEQAYATLASKRHHPSDQLVGAPGISLWCGRRVRCGKVRRQPSNASGGRRGRVPNPVHSGYVSVAIQPGRPDLVRGVHVRRPCSGEHHWSCRLRQANLTSRSTRTRSLHRHCATKRAGERTPPGAMPLRAGQLDVIPRPSRRA